MSAISGRWAKSFGGMSSKKRVSYPMIAVTGAAFVLSTLPEARAGSRRALASGVLRKRMRAGHVLALVGPCFMMS